MYDYIVVELPNTLSTISELSAIIDLNNASVFGHSMGGGGCLSIFLKNLSKYKSCSAFAPVSNPLNCKWGQKAFKNYLGENNKKLWNEYDSFEIIKKLNLKSLSSFTLLIDQGTNDFALTHGDDNHNQLRTKEFKEHCDKYNIKCNLRWQNGYGHGYEFIASFVEDHIKFHAKELNPKYYRSIELQQGLINKVQSIISYIDDYINYPSNLLHQKEDIYVPPKFDTAGKVIKCKAAIAWKELYIFLFVLLLFRTSDNVRL